MHYCYGNPMVSVVIGWSPWYPNDLDKGCHRGFDQCKVRQESHAANQRCFPGTPTCPHWTDNQGTYQGWENKVWDFDYHSRPSERHLWRSGKKGILPTIQGRVVQSAISAKSCVVSSDRGPEKPVAFFSNLFYSLLDTSTTLEYNNAALHSLKY